MAQCAMGIGGVEYVGLCWFTIIFFSRVTRSIFASFKSRSSLTSLISEPSPEESVDLQFESRC